MQKMIFLLFVLLSVNVANAQTVEDLINRHQPPKGQVTPTTKSRCEKFIKTFTPEDETWGVGYCYSEHFPLILSANYTYSCLSVSAELGFNIDGDKYTVNQYNPIGHFIISPGFYGRFFAINCGVGFMYSNYTETKYWGDSNSENWGDGSSISGSTTTTVSGSTSTSATKCHFVLKPSITGYIPISDEDFYLTINAGYNYIPKFKELNGWSFGVGFQWVIW